MLTEVELATSKTLGMFAVEAVEARKRLSEIRTLETEEARLGLDSLAESSQRL